MSPVITDHKLNTAFDIVNINNISFNRFSKTLYFLTLLAPRVVTVNINFISSNNVV